ncbi:MAG: GH36-type glycosyl hydrolase domain-containing protein [Candidatus Coproplasma sp.]
MIEKSVELFKEIQKILQGHGKAENRLPENAWFIGEDCVACFPTVHSESRYPYSVDGFTLWAYRSGYISVNESTFTLFPNVDEGKQPYLAFFAGKKCGEEYIPYSLTGVASQPRERVNRCTVFTPSAAYYLVAEEDLNLSLRIALDNDKSILLSMCAQNNSSHLQEVYLASYINCLMRYMMVEDVESKWFKVGKKYPNGFIIESVVDVTREKSVNFYAAIAISLSGNQCGVSSTTSRADFAGGKNKTINCAEALFKGEFTQERPVCGFTDTAIAGEITRFNLPGGGFCEQDIVIRIYTNKEEAEKFLLNGIAPGMVDKAVQRLEEKDKVKHSDEAMLRMNFGATSGEINGGAFEKFVSQVIRQVEYCALAKTSTLSMLGMRDVFQQIESALMWNSSECRKKMLEAFSFIGIDGRVPRQYSLPACKGGIPVMDLREFIDQGLWIIDAVYTYLAYTGDVDFLKEECGYYVYRGRETLCTDEHDSVEKHLLRIIDFLIENLDKNTGCLRILYGDWNDALDGLGTNKSGEGFGSGVSVMATLQLYKALGEMAEILEVYGGNAEKAKRLRDCRIDIGNSLNKFALQKKDGKRRILHGWGDKQEYFVGSYNDVDGVERDALTANAFWVLSDLYEDDKSIKADILSAYERLDSKYGLKTFEPAFERGCKGVGRIPNLPAGTAENGAVYVHATLFAIWSLFKMGESKVAWEQLFKIIPLSHEFISTSPFVMSNSYVCNEQLNADGESMSDWYTGSATVLIKVLCRCVFGIELTQTHITINPAEYIPFDNAEISICVRGNILKVRLERDGDNRKLFINGTEYKSVYTAELPSTDNISA